MAKVTAYVKLSEAGRKDAAIKGFNAKEFQEIIFEIEGEDLKKYQDALSIYNDGTIAIRLQDSQHILTNKEKKEYSSYYFSQYPDSIEKVYSGWKEFQEMRERRKIVDAEEEVKKILEQLHSPVEELIFLSGHEEIEGIRYSTYRAIKMYDDPRLEDRKNEAQEYADQKTEQAKAEAEKIAKEKAATKEKAETEKKSWIEAHGSEHLKKVFHADYPHQKAYVQERAIYELGEGWFVDFNDKANWDTKVMPSEKALDLETELEQKGYEAEIVWLKYDGKERDYEDEPFEPCEAMMVRNFLGKYDVLKIM